jgi:hypothetical protein
VPATDDRQLGAGEWQMDERITRQAGEIAWPVILKTRLES